MCMAHGHTTFNFALGLSFGNALSLPPGVTLVGATCLAGAGTLCDIDCKGSTVSTAFGPFSEAAHYGSVHLHHMVSAAMYSDHDFEAERTEHRGLTHWWPFWLVVGAGVWAGCAFVGQWFAMGVIAVLFAVAARGLTIPDVPSEKQDRFVDSLSHELVMKNAYRLLWLCPFTWTMRRAKKSIRRTRRYTLFSFFGRDYGFSFGIGKVLTLAVSIAIAYALTVQGMTATLAPYLGLLVAVGMLLHWVGDSPTHMGVPGFLLHHKWKLPFWASFYAGGPFEVVIVWFGFGWLNTILLLGTAGAISHDTIMQIILWGGIGLGAVMVAAIVVEGTQRTKQRRYAT